MSSLEFDRCQHAKGGVSALTVVEDLPVSLGLIDDRDLLSGEHPACAATGTFDAKPLPPNELPPGGVPSWSAPAPLIAAGLI